MTNILPQYPDPQYLHKLKKGSSVKHWSGIYRAQDDKGWLHIIITANGRREKVSVERLCMPPGSIQDYIFNGWHQHYSWDEYRTFAAAEMSWIVDY